MKRVDDRKQTKNVNGFWARKWNFFLVLVFGLILGMGIWGRLKQMPVGDDASFHIARLQSASNAWSNGQIIPQIDPNALGGMGYAYNLFYGPLVSYGTSAIQFVVQNWAVTINLVLLLALILSGITMCYTVTKISKNRAVGALAGIFYMATPYVLTDLYLRVALGETLAFIVAPILLLGLYQITTNERNATRNLAIAVTLLVLSHSLSAFLFVLMAVIYAVLNIDKFIHVKSIWRVLLAVIVTVGLTAFFTLPLLEVRMGEGTYGIFDASYIESYFGANGDTMNDHRLWPADMLLGGSQRGEGAIVGVVAIFGLIGFFMIWRKINAKQDRRFLLSLFIISVLALAFTTPLINWNYAPKIFLGLQFPWRLLEIVALTTNILSAYVCGVFLQDLAEEKQRVAALLVGILAIVPVTSFFLPNDWGHVEAKDSDWAETSSGSLGWQAEYAPTQMLCSENDPDEMSQDYKCSLMKIEQMIEQRGMTPRVLHGKAGIIDFEKDGLGVRLRVKNETEFSAEIELPLIYYPGYEAWYGDKTLEVGPSDELGLVTVSAPAKTNGEIEVFYGVSDMTWIGVVVTSLTLVVGVTWLAITAILDTRTHKKDAEIEKLMDSMRDVIDVESTIKFETEEPKKEDVVAKEADAEMDSTEDEKEPPKAEIKKTKANNSRSASSMAPKTAKTTKKKPSSAKTVKTATTRATKPKTTRTTKTAKTTAKPVSKLTSTTNNSKITKVKATSRVRKDPE